MYKLTQTQIDKIYGGILGKLIGVRLGGPIETDSAAKILKEHPHIDGFMDDCDNKERLFRPDDDTNGFLFFLKVLEHLNADEEIKPRHMADVILNLANDLNGEGRCFFWWSNSAEKKAYRRLFQGVPPEEAGLGHKSDYIGGEIFYDQIGLVFAGDVNRAVHYTDVMAGVMHNGEGRYGGMFINACISYAFYETDVKTIVIKALTHIPPESIFADMVRKMLAFYEKNPYDWRAALYYAEENYAHWFVWDFTALILVALLYGNGSFPRSMEICMHCGRDADCTGGNLGAILGVLNGYQGIWYQRWIEPMGDVAFGSSALGYENEVSITQYTARILLQVCKFGGYEPEPWWKKAARLDTYLFPFPYSTQNFDICRWRNHEKKLAMSKKEKWLYDLKFRRFAVWTEYCENTPSGSPYALRFQARDTKAKDKYEIYRPFERNEKFADDKYGPSVCRHLLPGQKVSVQVMTPDSGIWVKLWAENWEEIKPDSNGGVLLQPNQWQKLEMEIPVLYGVHVYDYINIEVYCQNDAVEKDGFKGIVLWIDDMTITGVPSFCINGEYSFEHDPYCISNHATRCFGETVSYAEDGFYLEASEYNSLGMLLAGQTDKTNYQFHAVISPRTYGTHLMNFAVRGIIKHYAFGFYGENQIALLKTTHLPGKYEILQSRPFVWQKREKYIFHVNVRKHSIECWINNECVFFYETDDSFRGGVGFTNCSDSVQARTKIYFENIFMCPIE